VAIVKVLELARLLEAKAPLRTHGLGAEVTVVHAGDQMSEVLASAVAGSLLVTGLTNGQVVRTAEVAGLSAIVIVGGKPLLSETIQAADRAGIPVIQTGLSMFEACGRLHAAGLRCGARRVPEPRVALPR
jgi:predicted transcriptional regulator